MLSSWEKIARDKRESLIKAIPKEWILHDIPTPDECPNACELLNNLLPPEETEITTSSILYLMEKLSNGELTATSVTKAFCHRAALTHQITNCCSEIFFERALSRAKLLDDYYEKNQTVIGPLHGIPISLKDQVNLEGIDSAIGYVGRLNNPMAKDQVSLIAEILENSGAVFYVKTTTPMAMMSGDTISNIYGYTVNSLNRKLSSGGSSGGEGSLIGAYGSLLGFGTDIGGSIRIPSSFQGLYGLRCSSNRIPYCNVTNSMAHQPIMSSVIGPMCHNAKDLKFITKLVIDSKPWMYDPKCPPIPWRESTIESFEKLSFGFLSDTEIAYLHPPVQRALKTVRESLIRSGHEIIEWDPPITTYMLLELAKSIYGADAYKEILENCSQSGEPVVKEILSLAGNSATLPKGVKDINEHWDQGKLKYEYQRAYDNYWLSTSKITSTRRPVDGLIWPVWASCSYKSGDIHIFDINFTASLNVLDYSAVSTPVLKADKAIDLVDKEYSPVNKAEKLVCEYYVPELYHDTPVGVQVIAPRYEEERAIALAQVINESLE